MKTRLLHLWDNLTTSYWFIPTAMVIAATVVAFIMLWVDRNVTVPEHSAWIYTGGPDGARLLLSTVAGSVITVAGVVFSITIAALVQASSQFGPRLLRNFMRDTGNQVVLGTFVATFMYCLLILRSIRGAEDYVFVPNLSVTFAVVMAVGSLAVLIYFIDHISRSLQAPQLVAAVGLELERAIRRPYPTGMGSGDEVQRLEMRHAAGFASSADQCAIHSKQSGYLQAIDEDGLLELARKKQVVVHLDCRPGDFISKGQRLLWIDGAAHRNAVITNAFIDVFFIGRQRTAEQDLEYSIRQLVEIAVRALSPGINDPFTAVNCIDWLGASIAAVGQHGLPSRYRYDAEGHCRVIADVSTFAGLADASFNQIRQFGGASVAVSIRVLEVFASVGSLLHNADQRRVLLHHAEMVHRQGMEVVKEPNDRADIKNRFESAMAALRIDSEPALQI